MFVLYYANAEYLTVNRSHVTLIFGAFVPSWQGRIQDFHRVGAVSTRAAHFPPTGAAFMTSEGGTTTSEGGTMNSEGGTFKRNANFRKMHSTAYRNFFLFFR